MECFERPASAALAPFVDRLWGVRTGPTEEVAFADVLPGTGAELLLHLGNPLTRADGSRLPAAHLLCLRAGPLRLAPSAGGLDLLAIRFRAGALRHFFPLPPVELADRQPPLEEVVGRVGAALCDELADAPTFAARASRAEVYLARALARFARPDPLADRAVAALYASGGGARVEEVAVRLGVGRRHLARRVGASLGVSPKRFARLVRFQKAARRLVLERRRDYAPVALELGFFDQAHFVHEFTALAGCAPGAFLRATAGRSHFYKRPLPR